MKSIIRSIRNLKIRYKIAFILNVFSILIIGIVSVVHTLQFKEALQDRIFLQLTSIRHLKTIQISNLLDNHLHEIERMLDHIDNEAYLDALAEDEFVHIDSIVIANDEAETHPYTRDSVTIIDISEQIQDGKIHLEYSVQDSNVLYLFYSTPRKIQQILFERTGMGATGETYIVGADRYLRTVSRFFPDSIPSQLASTTDAVSFAFSEGEEGSRIHLDYRGKEVLSSYAPFYYKGLKWVILSEIDKVEALEPMRQMEQRIYGLAVLIFMVVFLVSNFLAQLIVKPILKVQMVLHKISLGEKTEVEKWKGKDEIGDLFNTLETVVQVSDHIIVFANHIAQGTFDKDMSMRGEKDELVEALNNMKYQLIDLKERERTLILKNQRQLVAGEEKERTRLSRELHDSIGPLLTNLKLMVEQSKSTGKDAPEITALIRHIIEEVRKISVNLMPSVLKDFGLVPAVENFLKLQFSASPIKITFQSSAENENTMPHEIALNIFRIIQEAMNNAIKYSEATEIQLSVTEFENQVNVFIHDNGKGFDPHTVRMGNGLINMKERVNMFNGHWELHSNTNGTTIELEILTDNA